VAEEGVAQAGVVADPAKPVVDDVGYLVLLDGVEIVGTGVRFRSASHMTAAARRRASGPG